MLVHDDASHLWVNVIVQLVLAWIAVITRQFRNRRSRSVFRSASISYTSDDESVAAASDSGGIFASILAHVEITLAYLLGVYLGGLVFHHSWNDSAEKKAGLVGGSAGGFGLAGLCLVDCAWDLAEIVRDMAAKRKEKKVDEVIIRPDYVTQPSLISNFSIETLVTLKPSHKVRLLCFVRSILILGVLTNDLHVWGQYAFEVGLENVFARPDLASEVVHLCGFFGGIFATLAFNGFIACTRRLWRLNARYESVHNS